MIQTAIFGRWQIEHATYIYIYIICIRNNDLTAISNSILAVGDENDLDNRRSKYAFVSSLMEQSSFNDPDSYLWSVAD